MLNRLTYLFILLMAVGTVSCDPRQSEVEEELKKKKEELDQKKNDLEEMENNLEDMFAELESSADSIMNAMKVDFKAYEEVDRYASEESLEFNDYHWNMSFYFLFPSTPKFEKLEKDDHDTYTAAEIVDGKVYKVLVADYEELGEEVVDEGFTGFIHNGLVNHMGGERFIHETLKADYYCGFYSCYQYELEGEMYLVDHVTYGFYDKMVHLIVTAQGKFESSSRVQEFIDGFEIIP